MIAAYIQLLLEQNRLLRELVTKCQTELWFARAWASSFEINLTEVRRDGQ